MNDVETSPGKLENVISQFTINFKLITQIFEINLKFGFTIFNFFNTKKLPDNGMTKCFG